MTNTDPKLAAFLERMMRLETSQREIAVDKKELKQEMRSAGLSKAEIAGLHLATMRAFETAEKRAERTAAEEVADLLAASGAPLFSAAA